MTTRRRWPRRAMLILSIGAIYFAAIRWCFRIDSFVLITRSGHVDAPTGARRIITQTSDGKFVEMFALPASSSNSDAPEAYVLRFSGNARAETMVQSISRRWGGDKIEAWVMNYPGSGGSQGPASLANIAPAALAAFDALHADAHGKPIYVDGNSFGASVALYVTANRPVAGAMIQNPPPIRELARARFRGPMLWFIVWPVSFQVPDQLDSIVSASHCTAPAIFIHSIHDANVPGRFQQMVIQEYRAPHHEMQLDGDHETQPEAAAADLADAIRWLRQTAGETLDQPAFTQADPPSQY